MIKEQGKSTENASQSRGIGPTAAPTGSYLWLGDLRLYPIYWSFPTMYKRASLKPSLRPDLHLCAKCVHLHAGSKGALQPFRTRTNADPGVR